MKEKKYIVSNSLGIHARPAAEIAKIASQFKADISLSSNGKNGNAKSLLMIMAMGVKSGQELTVTVNGNDEDEAINALDLLFTNNFYED